MRAGANPHPPGSDEYFTYDALQLANEGMGWTSPNPLVGCVLVRDGVVIGRGHHACDGEQHAEVRALAAAGDARGATCYVSLEPCSHVGRQPSCCHELAKAGIQRVVWGAEDRDPRTAARAQEVLPELGLEVTPGVLKAECEEFLDYYLLSRSLRRPFFHLKLALSLDGKVAEASGHNLWFSGALSHGYAHYLRLKYDGILVGYRTVLTDNPRLTVRPDILEAYRDPPESAPLRQPARIIIDPQFTIVKRLSELRVFEFNGHFREKLPRLIVVGRKQELPDPQPDIPHMKMIGIQPRDDSTLGFAELASELWCLGVQSVLVEGGGALAAEMLRQQLVDKLSLVYTPLMVGADGIGFSPSIDPVNARKGMLLSPVKARALGEDALLEGYPTWY